MLKGSWRKIVSVLFVFLCSFIYLFISNYNYLKNKGNFSQLLTNEQIELINWVKDKDYYLSKSDPQVVIHGVNGYVKYLDVDATLSADVEVKVYYTNSQFKRFNEITTLLADVTYSENSMRINIDKEVKDLRVDFGEEAGLLFNLSSISAYPTHFSVDYFQLVLCISMSWMISLIVYYPFRTWKNLILYMQVFMKYSYLLSNLVKKDVTTKYRRSVLGIVWSVLNPLLMMIVITAVFQRIFRFEVANFPLYYLTGSVLFTFVSDSTINCMGSINGASTLIKKVYIPKYIFPLEKCIFSLINMLYSMIAVIVIFFVLKVTPPLTIFLLPIPIFYTFVFCVGFGMVLTTLNVYFRDTSHLYGVLVTAWLYITPIIYPIDILPFYVKEIVKFNPLYYYVEYFRNVVLYGIVPSLQDNLICIFFSGLFLIIGLIVFKNKQDKFILYI